MKFTADRGILMQALARTQGIADKKTGVNNVLAHILMESIDENTIRIKCTDYDVVLVTTFQATVEKKGKIAVNARSFHDSIRLWQDTIVKVETTSSGNIECVCGTTKASLMSFDPEDFPPIEKDESKELVQIPTSLLASMAAQTAPFMSDDPSRMNLNGVLIRITKEEKNDCVMTAVATDGNRMAVIEKEILELDIPFSEKQAIIHRKGVFEIKKLLDDSIEESTGFGFSNGEIIIRNGNSTLYIRQIDEEFPNYGGVIPSSFAGELIINKNEFINAIRIASPIVQNHNQGIKLAIRQNTINISGSRSDLGNIETDVVSEYNGDEISVGYNFKYMLEALANIETENVVIGITGEESPSLVRSDLEEDKSIFIVMPMELG